MAEIRLGGLKLVDMRLKDMSLKIAWIFSKNPMAQLQLNKVIPPALGTLFWDCTIQPQDIDIFIKKG